MPTLRRLAAVAAVLLAAAAQAGLKITTEMKRKGKTSALTMQMDGKKLSMEMTKDGSAEPGGAFISDGDAKKVLIVDYAKKEYHEITQEQMKQWKAKVDAAMAQAKSQLAKLPPEQRAKIEAMMSQQMKAPAIPEEKYTRASGTKKIAGYSCDLYTVEQDGKKVADTCLIPWADLKLDREQIKQGMEAMEDTWSMGGTLPKPAATNLKAWGMAIGLPAWRRTVKDEDEDVTESTLTGITQGSVPKSAFEPPAGFTKRAMGEK